MTRMACVSLRTAAAFVVVLIYSTFYHLVVQSQQIDGKIGIQIKLIGPSGFNRRLSSID